MVFRHELPVVAEQHSLLEEATSVNPEKLQPFGVVKSLSAAGGGGTTSRNRTTTPPGTKYRFPRDSLTSEGAFAMTTAVAGGLGSAGGPPTTLLKGHKPSGSIERRSGPPLGASSCRTRRPKSTAATNTVACWYSWCHRPAACTASMLP